MRKWEEVEKRVRQRVGNDEAILSWAEEAWAHAGVLEQFLAGEFDAEYEDGVIRFTHKGRLVTEVRHFPLGPKSTRGPCRWQPSRVSHPQRVRAWRRILRWRLTPMRS